jgi:hypothetical protein
MNHDGYPPLLDHVLDGGLYRPLLESPDVEQHRERWRAFFKELAACPPKDSTIAERFHTKWHESHHFIRELVADDDLMIDVMWVWLPRYHGPSMLLYRGENIDRFEGCRIGTAWTDQLETARMFASGLNAMGKGGVILRAEAPAEAIIAGPSDHSANWLRENEFTVDPRKLARIDIVERFGPNVLLN